MPKLPTRLRHNAYVTCDMEATWHFYEDLIDMPLVATWCESDDLWGKEQVYWHASSARKISVYGVSTKNIYLRKRCVARAATRRKLRAF